MQSWPALGGLPPELILIISEYCPKQDRMRLSSTSRKLRNITRESIAAVLFEHITLGLNSEDLNRLYKTASGIGKHVRWLTVNTELLPVLSPAGWVEYAARSLSFPEPLFDSDNVQYSMYSALVNKSSVSHVDTWSRQYQELASWQRSLVGFDNPSCRRLESDLIHFSNLNKIELVHSKTTCDYTDWFDQRGDWPANLAPCSPWRRFPINPVLYWREMHDWYHSRLLQPTARDDCSSAALHYIMAAVASLQAPGRALPLRELGIRISHIDPLPEDAQGRLRNLPTTYSSQISHALFGISLLPVFTTLTNLTLIMSRSLQHLSEVTGTEIWKWLKHAHALRSLTLDLEDDNEEVAVASELATYGMTTPFWPQIRTLHLVAFIHPDCLLALIIAHRQSLAVLNLEGTSLRRHHNWLSWAGIEAAIDSQCNIQTKAIGSLWNEGRRTNDDRGAGVRGQSPSSSFSESFSGSRSADVTGSFEAATTDAQGEPTGSGSFEAAPSDTEDDTEDDEAATALANLSMS